MISKGLVTQIVEGFIETTDHYLVDVIVASDNRISVEIDALNGVAIEFCVELNRYIESKLDRDVEDYELEVGSSGLTAPFKVLKQYEKNIGNEVEVLTKDGQKLTGVLVEVSDLNFTIEVEKQMKLEGAKRKTTVRENIVFPYDEIKTTKYIFRFK